MAKKKKNANKEKKKGAFGMRLLIIMSVLLSVLFLPTTVMLCIGMVPTFVVFFVNIKAKKSKVITVGAANFAGCSPFMFELWKSGRDMSQSLHITLDPQTIMIMYGAALVGYIIDWALTGIVAGIMVERGKARMKNIRKRQTEMVDRWGKKVTGEQPLDPHGFPIEKK